MKVLTGKKVFICNDKRSTKAGITRQIVAQVRKDAGLNSTIFSYLELCSLWHNSIEKDFAGYKQFVYVRGGKTTMKTALVQEALGMFLCHDVTQIIPDGFKGLPSPKKNGTMLDRRGWPSESGFSVWHTSGSS